MWRLPLAWALTVGVRGLGHDRLHVFAWLPTLLVDTAGVTPAAAGALLSLFAAMGLPASLARSLLVVRYNATRALFRRRGRRRALAGIAGLSSWLPSLGAALALLGLGIAAVFPLTLGAARPARRARTRAPSR